jgi:hypothetical protein
MAQGLLIQEHDQRVRTSVWTCLLGLQDEQQERVKAVERAGRGEGKTPSKTGRGGISSLQPPSLQDAPT